MSLAAALFLWAPAVLAGEVGGGGKRPQKESGLRGEYAIMADLMKLDDATKAKFGEVLTANEKAGMEWGLMAAKKVQELTPALEEARAAKDEGLVKAIGAELSKLSADRNKIAVDGKARIMALLTDEQKVMWEGFELRRVVMQVLGGVNLSDEQRDKLQKLCEEKARQLGTVTMFPTVTDN